MPKKRPPARTRKPSAEPTAKAAIPAAPPPKDKRPLLIIAAVLLVGVLAALAVWRPWEQPAAPVVAVSAAPPTFVGSQACAELPRQRATKAWTDSQHARAMQEATEAHRSRRFRGSPLRTPRQHRDLFQARWQVFRAHRRPGWQARRLRGQVHVRRRAPAAVPDRAARRSPAGAYRGLGHDREALVQSVSERNASRRTTNCIGPEGNRTGISFARTVIRRTCARTTTRPPIRSRRRGRKFMSVANRATGRARTTSPGRPSATAIRAWD